jgi:hypothetical protein
VRLLPEAQAAGVDVLGLVHEQRVGASPSDPPRSSWVVMTRSAIPFIRLGFFLIALKQWPQGEHLQVPLLHQVQEDVWVKVVLNDEAEIAELIDQTTATRNPFDKKYSKVEDADWETCATVLNPISVRELMERGWYR